MSPNKNNSRSANEINSRTRHTYFDIAGPRNTKSTQKFPAVGMTLNAYRGNSGLKMPKEQQNQPAAPADNRAQNDIPAPTPVAGQRQAPQKKASKLKKLWRPKRIALILAALVLLIGGWLGFKVLYNTHKLFGGSVFDVFRSTPLKGESEGRVNILMAGNSADDPGHDGANLTDSIMILSIDTKNHTAFMVSVPRDLWIAIPGDGHSKINRVYPAGQENNFSADGYPSGGMGQLEQVIQKNLGITCHYYALVDYTALRDAVNAVGGIDITIKSSDPRGLYDPNLDWGTNQPLVKLSNGVHHLDGRAALNLARARGDSYRSYGYEQSDFTRTQMQREIILAIRHKATSAGVLTNPVKLSELFDAVGKNVKTDLTLSNVRRLYDVTKDINQSSIQSVGLNDAGGKNLLSNYTSSDGQAALIPAAGLDDFSNIRTYLRQLMSTDPVVREGATITVLNGTDTAGLATKWRNSLSAKNFDVISVGDADTNTPVTTLIDTSGGKNPLTLKALQQVFTGSKVTTTNPYTSYSADIIVIIGADKIPASSTTKTTP